MDTVWITDKNTLNVQAEQWRQCDAIFIDSEFQREKTFYPILALLQINDGSSIFLIEPDAAEGAEAFLDLLQSIHVKKVFHAASEDCEVIFRHLGIKMKGVWDTQVVEQFLDEGEQRSYAKLVSKYCGEELEKDVTRSDWLQRPLTEKQIRYAVDDVRCLQTVYKKQRQHAQFETFESWIAEDCQAIENRVDYLDDISSAYLDIKNGWQLNAHQLKRLQALSEWREITARKKNVPKPFIAKNSVIWTLAKLGLQQKTRLPHIKEWHPVAKRKYGQDIVNVINQADDQSDVGNSQATTSLPSRADSAPTTDDVSETNESMHNALDERPLSPKFWQQYTQEMQAARDIIDSKANTLGLAPDLLCSKKTLRGFVKYLLNRKKSPPLGWTNWRNEQLADPIRQIFCDNSNS